MSKCYKFMRYTFVPNVKVDSKSENFNNSGGGGYKELNLLHTEDYRHRDVQTDIQKPTAL